MKRRRIILVLALAVVATGILLCWPRGPKEPVYQGKRLSVWMSDAMIIYKSTIDPGEDERLLAAKRAIRALGTNALPWLMYEFNRRQPRWTDTANRWASKFQLTFLRVESERERVFRVTLALQLLGTNAVPALPALAAALSNPVHGGSAAGAMSECGAVALPFLREAADSADPYTANHGARAVGQLAGTVPEAFDALMVLLTHTNRSVRNMAALRMAELKRQRDLSLPVLIEMLASTKPGERQSAAIALGSMYTEAKPTVPTLVKLLSDSNPLVAHAAREALLQIDPAALPPPEP